MWSARPERDGARTARGRVHRDPTALRRTLDPPVDAGTPVAGASGGARSGRLRTGPAGRHPPARSVTPGGG